MKDNTFFALCPLHALDHLESNARMKNASRASSSQMPRELYQVSRNVFRNDFCRIDANRRRNLQAEYPLAD